MHIDSQSYTQTHTQTPDLMFLLSRRSMNKTGVQRLSEKHWETWGVLADLCAAVAVCSPHNLHVWTCRISSLLDAVCAENTHSFANLSVQTCTHIHLLHTLNLQKIYTYVQLLMTCMCSDLMFLLTSNNSSTILNRVHLNNHIVSRGLLFALNANSLFTSYCS